MHAFIGRCTYLRNCCSVVQATSLLNRRSATTVVCSQQQQSQQAGQVSTVGCFEQAETPIIQPRLQSSQPQQLLPQQQQQQQQPAQQYIPVPEPAGTYHVSLKELKAVKGKVRLDAYLATQLPTVSRAKISASIKAGLVQINGSAVVKPSHSIRGNDVITVELLPPEPCTAVPEGIPLDVVYEDDHLIVVNKAAGMVVHISPGHSTGTLVNALLAHCGLPACEVLSGNSSQSSSSGSGLLSHAAAAGGSTPILGAMVDDDLDEGEDDITFDYVTPEVTPSAASSTSNSRTSGILRPGIVHRLDRGTSGLMVVAKTDFTHAHLCGQFKERSVSRIYNSITCGVPTPTAARVATNIVRDPGNRLRMMAATYGSGKGRTAASNYQCLERLAGGGAALVQWKLETGRTHQIRVHAKHIGHALLGDDLYGPGHTAAAKMVAGRRSSLVAPARAAFEEFARPALHAKTLGFTHPVTGKRLEFDSHWPEDFTKLYGLLKEWA